MKVGVLGENLIERAILASGIVPTPVLETVSTLMMAKSIAAATKLGVFEALADGPLSCDEVVTRCRLHARGTKTLLRYLASLGYLRFAKGRYDLSRLSRKWLVKRSRNSLYDFMMYQQLNWIWFDRCEEFLRTGKTIRMHEEMTEEQWDVYQRAMRALAGYTAPEVARRLRLSRPPGRMLDVGGSHGFYSVCFCRRYEMLRAVVIDLPKAVQRSAATLKADCVGIGERVTHQVGDVLEDDWHVEPCDLILVANLVHHFDDETNRRLVARAARYLRPGGVLAIQDFVRPADDRIPGTAAAESDFYFALASESGAWSIENMSEWQRSAGLVPTSPLWLRTVPGAAVQAASRS